MAARLHQPFSLQAVEYLKAIGLVLSPEHQDEVFPQAAPLTFEISKPTRKDPVNAASNIEAD